MRTYDTPLSPRPAERETPRSGLDQIASGPGALLASCHKSNSPGRHHAHSTQRLAVTLEPDTIALLARDWGQGAHPV